MKKYAKNYFATLNPIPLEAGPGLLFSCKSVWASVGFTLPSAVPDWHNNFLNAIFSRPMAQSVDAVLCFLPVTALGASFGSVERSGIRRGGRSDPDNYRDSAVAVTLPAGGRGKNQSLENIDNYTEKCVLTVASRGGEFFPRQRFFLLLIVAGFIALFSSCSQNNVKQDDSLKKYFEENNVTGTFALMDNGTGLFTVYNLKRYRDSAYLPASTFKIVNALIGLQTGKITSDSMVIPWDGVQRPVPEWNKELNMYQAFRASAVPYFQEVARRIGKDTMQFWLDSLHYGTGKKDTLFRISGAVDTFWLDNTLKITPDENLGFVKKLYFNELPFFKLYQEKVKHAMLFENNANYKLAYKTGWAHTETNHALGWIVGWIEENKHPYFFVLNLESPDPDYDMSNVRLRVLKDILKQLGFFEGKM